MDRLRRAAAYLEANSRRNALIALFGMSLFYDWRGNDEIAATFIAAALVIWCSPANKTKEPGR